MDCASRKHVLVGAAARRRGESVLAENLNFKKLPTYGLAEQLRRTWKRSC